MARIWIHQSFADIEEEYDGSEKQIEDEINLSSLRLYTRDGDLIPFVITTPQQHQQYFHDEVVTVIKGDQSYSGILQSFTDDIVTILTNADTKLTIRHYDEIIYTTSTYLQSRISALDSGFLRYQTSSLSWSCRGDIFLSKDNKLSHLTAYAVINNTHRMDANQDIRQLTLVAGNQPTSQEPIYYESARPQAMLRSAAPMNIGSVSEPTFEDYMTFPLNLNELSLGSLYLPLFSLDLSQSKRVYFYNLQQERSPVRVGYLFDAPQDFPSCQVNVHDASGMFIGASQLDEKRKGESVRLYLGETSTILAKTYLTTENIPVPGNTFWSNTKVSITSQVKNTKEDGDSEDIIARYYVGRSKITQAKCQGVVTDDGYLEISLTLRPGEERVFTCSFVLEA